MTKLSRRNLVRGSTGLIASAALATPPLHRASAQAELRFPPEEGASLKTIRWQAFVQGDEDVWLANTDAFTELTGVPVEVESIPWETVGAEVGRTAISGSGPDIIIGWFDDPHRYPEALLDLSLLAAYLGSKYGGWYPVCERYGRRVGWGRWIGLPLGCSGTSMVYRRSHLEAAGFDSFPEDTDGLLALCRTLAERGTPPGLALGHAVGDANTLVHWLLWSFGGKLVDTSGIVVIDSSQTRAALDYARELYQTFVPGTTAWLDADNNQAFLAGEVSLTNNGISIYHSARGDPQYRAIADDLGQANLPIGPVGRPTELFLLSQAMVFGHTPYPNAAMEYLRFMWEQEQYEPWQSAAAGYVTQPLIAYEANRVWQEDPSYAVYQNATARMLWNGYAGELGAASAAVMADFVLVDMFAEAASGASTPDEAIARAEQRAVAAYHLQSN